MAGGVVGFEPTVRGTKNRCLTTWLHPPNGGGLSSQSRTRAQEQKKHKTWRNSRAAWLPWAQGRITGERAWYLGDLFGLPPPGKYEDYCVLLASADTARWRGGLVDESYPARPLASASKAAKLATSAGICARGIMFGPSEGARSGSGWVSMNTPPATPTATAARARTGANSRCPPLEPPLPPPASAPRGWHP